MHLDLDRTIAQLRARGGLELGEAPGPEIRDRLAQQLLKRAVLDVSTYKPVATTLADANQVANGFQAIQNVVNAIDNLNFAAGKIFAPSKLMQEAAVDGDGLAWDNATLQFKRTSDKQIRQAGIAFDAWQSYTPAWTASGTAPALGNGTLLGKYIQIGKTVIGRAILTMGSTTTFGTGNYSLSLPVAANTATPVGETVLGGASATDLGVGSYVASAILATGTTIFVYTPATPAGVWGQTAPFTWGNTDIMRVSFVYEAA